jgi:tryptophan halogenase
MKDRRSLKNIVVVGGGTAGWAAALYIQKVLPSSKITVVESDEIGILGAGEGSTPQLINYLDFIGVPVSQLIKEASATIKNGIKFTNWRNDGTHYYHSFLAFHSLGFSGCNIDKKYLSTDAAIVLSWSLDENVNDIDFIAKVSEANKVPFMYNQQLDGSRDPILKFDNLANFSIHFNAAKLATCLRSIAEERGVKRVEGVVTGFSEDSYGDIRKIILKDSSKIESDFVFDASGFARLIIGKHYKAEWKSHSDLLPVDSAVPFFIPVDEKKIPAYTESIAMKYGWMWKIPTRERFGCGYVYDSSLISEEDAVKEIEEYLGFEPEYPRKNKGGFKFKAGYYKTPYVKNCIAVGLASGFIEPLEATSIWVGLESLQTALANVDVLTSRDQDIADKYNERFRAMNDSIVEFIYFHYTSDRDDTPFWGKFKDKEKAPDFVKYLTQSWEKRLPQADDHVGKHWAMDSWLAVGSGIGTFDNKENAKNLVSINPALGLSLALFDEYKSRQDLVASSCSDHAMFLKELLK